MFDATVDPITQLREALEVLAGEERAGWPGVALSERLLELSALAERLDAEWLRCVGQWDAVQAWAEDGAVTASSWLASRTDVTRPNAVRKVRTARFAFAHAATGDALADGRLSAANAETLALLATRRRTTFVGDEDVILAHAPQLSPDAFAVLMHTWREYADDEEATDETSKPFEERFFRLTDTLDGAKLDGFVDPEAAALVRAALDAIDRPDPTNGPIAPRSSGSATPTRSSTSPKNRARAPHAVAATPPTSTPSSTSTVSPDTNPSTSSVIAASPATETRSAAVPSPARPSNDCAATPTSVA